MSVSYLIPPITALLILVSGVAPVARSQANYRDLKDYKQGPSLDLKDEYLDARKTALQIAPARQFLWEMWKSRTRGYFKETSYSVEGIPGWCTFFVETNSAGKWHVVLECKPRSCPFISKTRCRAYMRTLARETYDSVERIKAGYSVYSKSPPKILDSEEVSPMEYVVILRSSVTGHTGQL